jgi:hypothetical protein
MSFRYYTHGGKNFFFPLCLITFGKSKSSMVFIESTVVAQWQVKGYENV